MRGESKRGLPEERPANAETVPPEEPGALESSLEPEARIGHYRILRKLGGGGMGEVYLATDEILERRVAIKTVRSTFLSDPTAKARFLREARAVAALSHPNIATVYEAHETASGPYLVMELVEGETLHALCRRETVSADRWIEFAAQLVTALEHAHARGILHRDIKSSNVMVAQDGALKLLDFGLAQLTGESVTALTAEGAFLGTLHYAAPEVLAGGSADVRSEIYSLGVVLYELATGRLPFEGRHAASLVAAILRGESDSIRDWNPALPEGIERVIRNAMACEPGKRHASASELLAELHALRGVDEPAVPAAPKPPADEAVAVLPFESLTEGDELDWLGTGLAETLGVELGRLKGLRLVGRERLARALGQVVDLERVADLGNELGARWVVTGAFQRAGDRIRITYRLIDATDGKESFQGKVDGPWAEVFALQDRVAEALADALRREFVPRTEVVAPPDSRRLQAYELYARGRQAFYHLGKGSLEEAQEHFERAVELDADYAVAFAALGATHCMRYIHRTDPDDLIRAIRHLENAVALDPELGEPYPWLCYACMRQGHLERATRAGTRGVLLQPDHVAAHYFLGVAHLVNVEYGVDELASAVPALLDATVADGTWASTWFVLADAALRVGEVERARQYAEQADHLLASAAPQAAGRMVGAETLLGWAAARAGDVGAARSYHERSIEHTREVDHMYREQFVAQSTIGLAELDLRAGAPGGALALYRRAWQIAKQFPTMLGGERILVRAMSGMASAYAAEGSRSRALELAASAAQSLLELPPQNWFWGVGFGQLWFDLTLTRLHLGDVEGAMEALVSSVGLGWRDAEWLEIDPELEPLRAGPRGERFGNLLNQIRARPTVPFEPAGRSVQSVLR